MTNRELHPDTQAILLLCGGLGRSRSSEAPLTTTEYHKLAQWLHTNQMRPSDLLRLDGIAHLTESWNVPIDPERIARLIARGAALALAIESWSNKGLWVISRSDPVYPQYLKARLGRAAPAVLYGVGDVTLLAGGGLAVVGSRDVDAAALAFTQRVATLCGEQGIQVVSGAARGVDSDAMQAALAAGGTVVGVLADSLLKAAVAGKYRAALRAGRLVLITAYEPEVGFTVSNAMGRNKYIYTLSDYALVVRTSLETGGTWSGATENLSARWVPLFVRLDDTAPEGNRRLLEMGAIPLHEDTLAGPVALRDALMQLTGTKSGLACTTADHEAPSDKPLVQELPADSGEAQTQGLAAPTVSAAQAPPAPQQAEALVPQPRPAELPESKDLFEVIWPYLERELHIAKTERELAELFHIEVTQARSWLQRALEDGKVAKLNRPVRYIATSQQLQPLELPLL